MKIKGKEIYLSLVWKFIIATIFHWIGVILYLWSFVFVIYGNHQKYNIQIVVGTQFIIFFFLSLVIYIYICKMIIRDMVAEELEAKLIEMKKDDLKKK